MYYFETKLFILHVCFLDFAGFLNKYRIFCSNPSMKFRNYLPHDKELQEGKLAPPVLPKFEDPVAVAPPPSEEKEVLGHSNFGFS